MKKYLLIILFALTFFVGIPSVKLAPSAHAQTPSVQPPDGAWLSDNDVTFAGKNAARSKDLFNWVLVNYQWSTDDNTLISFWAKIRNIVFVFLIILVMISAFMMIITGGQSLTAMQFIRKFVIVIVLITFSFALIRILYQIVDVIQGFFIRNPDGKIISSADLLNISFNYQDFTGFRRFGPEYNESAFISLLLTKITAATYFVMAGVLIIRKVILWFFITVSPIYPVLLLYFPIRNTAKIWIGEFFRWLLYAPLFAIFLSGLVVLWRQNINVLPFNFAGAGTTASIVYPTAINILLGGPGQKLSINNNINYTDTFAEYIVALIMLWVVIFLPFLLLRIFLDYLSTVSINSSPAWKYITAGANKIVPSSDFFGSKKSNPQPPASPPPSYYPTGMARELPLSGGQARAMAIPRSTSVSQSVGQVQSTQRPQLQTIASTRSTQGANPIFKSQQSSVATSQLVNFPIPTMRDVAKYETSRLSSNVSSHQDISRVNETLQKIANPQSITNPVERQQFAQIREKLVEAQTKGEPLAASILRASSTVTNRVTTTNLTNVSQQVMNQAVSNIQQTLQKMADPQSVSNTTEREKYTSLKEQVFSQVLGSNAQGNSYYNVISKAVTNLTQLHSQETTKNIQKIVQQLVNPQSITNVTEKEQVTKLKEEMLKAKASGDPVATSILAEADRVAKQTTQTVLPVTNQVQTVNLEDYEEVKKTWTENYRNLEVPKTLDQPDRTREQWIKDDLAKTTDTINLLTSQDQQKVKQGMDEVSSLLPFLLVGGFSQTEIVAYLQAKKHAADEVMTETQKKSQQDEETLLDTKTHHTEAVKHLSESMEAQPQKLNTPVLGQNPTVTETSEEKEKQAA